MHLKNYQIDFEIVDHYSLQQGGHIHLVDYLFECGARLRDLNSKKETPIDVAAKNHHQQIVSMLLEQEQRENVEGCSLLEWYPNLHMNRNSCHNPDSNPDPNPDPNPNPKSHFKTNSNLNSNSNPKPYPNPNFNSNSNPNLNPNLYPVPSILGKNLYSFAF